MRKKKIAEKLAVWLIIMAMAAVNVIPAAAADGGARLPGEVKVQEAHRNAVTPSNAEGEETKGNAGGRATSSTAEKEFRIEDMPEIGTDAFTKWFFDHTDRPELWDFILDLMDNRDHEGYGAFMEWAQKNETRFSKAYFEYTGIQLKLTSPATGDLWEQWDGAKMNWDGAGSENNPYKITSLSELMGLSEAVAQGKAYAGMYFKLQADIDLGRLKLNGGCWNPIGWYRNVTDLSGKPATGFSGIFDGGGYTISGLKFTKTDHEYSYLGLFGLLKNGVVKNLALEADEVSGKDDVALLAGCAEGNSAIYRVTVSGDIYANGDAGAIAGEMTGGNKPAVADNCTADHVTINSGGADSFVGGIAGNVQKADIVNCKAYTLDGDSNRIQGKGYVGGIAGRQNKADIYNSYVTGTIGGNLTKAVGGITGLYESGNIVVAQMDGQISPTNRGMASHEGAVIGTREPRDGFRYGTGRNDNLSYLYVGESQKPLTKSISGSGLADDNTYTLDAHIGYYTDFQKKYTQVAGRTEKGCGGRFYYEELEDGIRYIITQKLGKKLTLDYTEGGAFKLNHYAPGDQGEPVPGCLVSIPRIDTKNADGTYDNDVAVLTAISSTNNSYYRQIDKDTPSAVAPGCTVTVATAAKNRDGNRYQMVYDEQEAGKVKPPTYTDENGGKQDMTYVNGGSYSFVMPKSDTELNAEYIKVTTSLAITPDETDITVTQTRTGDRKNPQITTEVRDEEGTLIARYINGGQDGSIQVLPVSVHAEHNGEGSAADRTVVWSIDDMDLLHFEDGWTGGYSTQDARIIPNMDSGFLQGIINREVQAQADGGYQQAIKNTVYTDSAVVTAATNPATSVDHKAVTGTCKVNVDFQIVDLTTLRVEEMVLNRSEISFEVIRKLTGDRKNPKEEYLVTEPIGLDVSLKPSQSFYKNVTWTDTEAGKIISLTPSGVNQQSCSVAVVYNVAGKDNPAWIQNIINADNSRKTADGGYLKLTGSGTQTEEVTAASEDQTHGVVSAACGVTIRFRTDDETVIRPESVELSKTRAAYDLKYQYEGDAKSNIKTRTGFGERDRLTATVFPDIEENDGHKPYQRAVDWTSSDTDALTVDDGVLIVNDNAAWIKEAMKQAPYQAEKTVTVTAAARDGKQAASCEVTLVFQATAIEADRDSETFDIVLTKSGRRSDPTLTWTGEKPKTFTAGIFHAAQGVTAKWACGDPALLTVTEDGTVTPVLKDAAGNITAGWISEAMKNYPYKAMEDTAVTVSASDGSMMDTIPVKLMFSVIDHTYSGGGGGGGSSSGGGGSSGGMKPGAHAAVQAPSGCVTGSWRQDAAGNWLFAGDGRTYADEWAYVYNPYAGEGQPNADWFRFDKSGFMMTGWYTDVNGNTYYLNTLSDNTLGCMYTGWHWIDGNGDGTAECFFFNPVSDGTKGRLFKNIATPDGFTVNEKGQWTINGVVQTR